MFIYVLVKLWLSMVWRLTKVHTMGLLPRIYIMVRDFNTIQCDDRRLTSIAKLFNLNFHPLEVVCR